MDFQDCLWTLGWWDGPCFKMLACNQMRKKTSTLMCGSDQMEPGGVIHFLLNTITDHNFPHRCTWWQHRIQHRKWRATKLQPSRARPDQALPGCRLIYSYFRCRILHSHPVDLAHWFGTLKAEKVSLLNCAIIWLQVDHEVLVQLCCPLPRLLRPRSSLSLCHDKCALSYIPSRWRAHWVELLVVVGYLTNL